MKRSPDSPFRLTRRRAISLATATAALAFTGGPGRKAAAQATPVATPAGAALPPLPLPGNLAVDASPQFRAVAEALTAAMQAHHVPGAAIGLLSGDREEHAVFGLESLSSMRPVTPQTLFQIGSLTKTFTGTTIWHLIDAGVLELDAPVRHYIPDLTLQDATAGETVTVRNLLNHSAGFYGDEGFETGNGDDAIARYVAERLPQLPQLFPVGEFFSYNNAAFTLLGRLIEVATGAPYDAALGNLLLGPLGLSSTLLDHDMVRQHPYADGHFALLVNGKPTVAVQTPLFLPRSVNPAGSIWSTTPDLMRYARFHLGQGTIPSSANIVSPESLALMRTPSLPIPGMPSQMGLDWFVQEVPGATIFRHGGDTPGQHTDLTVIPEHNFALAVLTNGQGGGFLAAAAALQAAVAQIPALAPLAGQISSLQDPAADTPPLNLTPEALAEYAGTYADPSQTMTFTPVENGLELTLEQRAEPGVFTMAINPLPAPPMVVRFQAKDVAMLGGQRLPFVRDAQGRIGWVAFSLRLVPRVTPNP